MSVATPCPPMRREATSTDGCRIAWWSAGRRDGPAVVLLHGFALDHTVWAPLMKQSELIERCHLLLPDLRGHGASERMPTAAHYTDGAVWADDLAAVLRDAQVTSPTLVAWSFGGRVALDYVRRHGSDALHGIQFVAAAGLAHYASAGPDHAVLEALCAAEPATVDEATGRFVGEVIGAPRGSAEFDGLVAAAARCPVEHRRWMRQRGLDYDALIAALDLPLMWVNGSEDGIVLPSRAEAFRAVQPDTRVSLYEGARHAPFRDDPARFARELHAFVTHPPPSRRAARPGTVAA
ncbi:MAG: hypothetical protein DI564_09460 [Rhodanobacter denitrificans]|uniref:AB hydrolase-1 domain-containing protein n=1 Tax=Rhodanobacter denitrificans TaxID=666685 RepID=A0A2W5KCJ1_9GAMM|nr:MAG: hypothetical protein DI564_09460 [Rhodanobacter denitrificans]